MSDKVYKVVVFVKIDEGFGFRDKPLLRSNYTQCYFSAERELMPEELEFIRSEYTTDLEKAGLSGTFDHIEIHPASVAEIIKFHASDKREAI